MKVLHIYKAYFPDSIGGVEQAIHQIVTSSNLLGIDNEVLALSSKMVDGTIKIDNYYVHHCRSNFEISSTPFSTSVFIKFRKLAKEVDIIHYHFPYPFSDLLHFITRVNKPTVLTYHSDIVKQKLLLRLYRPLMNKFLGSVDYIVSTSPNYFKSSKVLERFRNKVRVIPIGLDKSTYATPNKDKLEYWQKKFGDKFFLFVGVLRYYKGLHILVEAAQNSYYPIIIVGAGAIEKELKYQVENLGINNIYFVGIVSEEDKVALLTLSYAILFPSQFRSEAFGVSLLEGAMYGKPLISSEIGTGTTYINIDGRTGMVIPPNDFGALREAMDYLWNNPVIAKKMGEHAEERYWDLFTAKKMAQSYTDLYQNLLNK
jgi:glycosyltransferase involved in cell wall biosynthesis